MNENGLPTSKEIINDLKTFIFKFERESAVDCLYISGALDIIEKELKALEIIKKHFKFRCLGISPHRDPSLDTCYVVTENIKEVPIEKWNFLKEVLEDE